MSEASAFVLELLLEKGPLPEGIEAASYRYVDTGHVDSLALIKFLFRLEERFGVRFTPEEINGEQIRTVGGLAGLIESKRR